MSWPRPSIRWLLLGVNAVVLAVPLTAVAALQLYDKLLMRQTERQLIAQSVVIGEAYRDAWRQVRGLPPAGDDDLRPPTQRRQRWLPIEPRIDWDSPVAPPLVEQFRIRPAGDSPALQAGARLDPLLVRSQVFNLSSARVLDRDGCVVATTGGDRGLCLDGLPEIDRALAGEYDAVARERVVEEPPPPLGDMRRRGRVRIFTAMPIHDAGAVIGVVRLSRTSLDALSSLWLNRRGLLVAALATLVVVVLISLFFAGAIARPLRATTAAAQAIAGGRRREPWQVGRFAPAELAALSEALDTMTRRLQQRADYVAEFASNVSHELKSPLTAVRGAAELLAQQWAAMDDAQRQRFIANIDADAARMERLVTRLLDLARLDTQAAEPAPALDPRTVITPLVERHGGAVQLVDDGAPALLAIAAEHLGSVAGNLIDNAVRHGAGQPVTVRLASRGDRLLIEVQDRGPGISPANQARLFSRFFTTERDRGGTGLGLAIVKAIAEARGGSVAVTSSERGSTFAVVL